MLIAFISDIHGNYDALEAVLAEIDRGTPDETICVGDIVGYGAEPARCIAELRDRNIPSVAGNHDFAVAGTASTEFFNPDAVASVLWTRVVISGQDVQYLRDLPLTIERDLFVATHGALANPDAFAYVLSVADLRACFDLLAHPVAFFGHSHVPIAFLAQDGNLSSAKSSEILISQDTRTLLNVGSVGQPRDSNPLAAYALYDTETRTACIHRVAYDVKAAMKKILAAGLPDSNAYRLGIGQ